MNSDNIVWLIIIVLGIMLIYYLFIGAMNPAEAQTSGKNVAILGISSVSLILSQLGKKRGDKK